MFVNVKEKMWLPFLINKLGQPSVRLWMKHFLQSSHFCSHWDGSIWQPFTVSTWDLHFYVWALPCPLHFPLSCTWVDFWWLKKGCISFKAPWIILARSCHSVLHVHLSHWTANNLWQKRMVLEWCFVWHGQKNTIWKNIQVLNFTWPEMPFQILIALTSIKGI